MSGLLQPATQQIESPNFARQADETLSRLRAEIAPRDFLGAMLRAFGDIQGECRAKEQFYRCSNQPELAMRFDNAARAALAANIAIQVAFDYEREESVRIETAHERDATSEGNLQVERPK